MKDGGGIFVLLLLLPVAAAVWVLSKGWKFLRVNFKKM